MKTKVYKMGFKFGEEYAKEMDIGDLFAIMSYNRNGIKEFTDVFIENIMFSEGGPPTTETMRVGIFREIQQWDKGFFNGFIFGAKKIINQKIKSVTNMYIGS